MVFKVAEQVAELMLSWRTLLRPDLLLHHSIILLD
jgi:hypothetical protein